MSEDKKPAPIAFEVNVQARGYTVSLGEGNTIEDFDAAMRRVADLMANVLGEAVDVDDINLHVSLRRAS